MIIRRKTALLFLGIALIAQVNSLRALPYLIRLPIATIEGATATALLLTAVSSLRSCLNTQFKQPQLNTNSAALAVQPGLKAKYLYAWNTAKNSIEQTICRNIEILAIKSVLLGTTAVTGLCGYYLARCSFRTLCH